MYIFIHISQIVWNLFPLIIFLKIYPLMVLQSGFKITWTNEVIKRVESKPSWPWTSTDEFSWSRHCAARHAQFNVSLTFVNQLLESRRDNHLSIGQEGSLHALIIQSNNVFEKKKKSLSFYFKSEILPSTNFVRLSRRVWYLSIDLWILFHKG